MSILAMTRPPRELGPGKWRCVWCGLVVESDKAPRSGTCESCRLTRHEPRKRGSWRLVASRVPGLEKCWAWLGDFDDDDNPIVGGALVLPGHRVCGHRDCVNPDHVRESL